MSSRYARTKRIANVFDGRFVPFLAPRSFVDLGQLNGKIMVAEGYELYARYLDDPDSPLDADVRARLLSEKDMPAHAYLSILRTREELKQEFGAALADCDALLTPTTATPALALRDVDQTKTPAHFTRFVNFLDLCALSLPNGASGDGLPTSLQIVCKRGRRRRRFASGKPISKRRIGMSAVHRHIDFRLVWRLSKAD
jgi:aspartyl-tRNA(Asn)/glutamyl-tRNA(Gln) amidotransferase subunit A